MKIAMHEITSNNASFEEDLKSYRKVGWTAFEMSLGKAQQYINQHNMNGFVKFVKDSGMKPVACTGHVVLAFASPDNVKANEDQFRQTLDVMEAVGCPIVVFGGDMPSSIPGAPNMSESGLTERDKSYRKELARFAEQVAKLADIAKSKGVTMALEMNWCGMCRSVVTASEAINMANRDNVGLMFDTAHFACTPSRLSDLELVKGKIVAGHLNDMRNCPPEIRNVNNDRVIPGDGVLPLVEWLNKVEECGFTGWHCVELFCDDLWKENALTIAQKVMDGCKRLWADAEF
jgi:2-keto-myo-inositol isomerase